MLCIASDFKHYDLHAVRLIDRNIELIRYRIFDANLLMLDLVHKVVASGNAAAKGGALDASDTPNSLQPSLAPPAQEPTTVSKDKSHVERLASASEEVKAIVEQLAEFTLSLGDDVTERPSHLYTAFRRLKNFVSVIAYTNRVLVMLKVDPSGRSGSEKWVDRTLDNHHHAMVLVDGYIYGSNWINNGQGNCER